METFSENHVHLDPSDPVEDDGPLSSFNCNTHTQTQRCELQVQAELTLDQTKGEGLQHEL